jgi:hypothetical protein
LGIFDPDTFSSIKGPLSDSLLHVYAQEDVDLLLKETDYIYKNMVYPGTARKNGVEGNVALVCKIVGKGKAEVWVMNGLDSDCDKEAIRVITQMVKENPSWYRVGSKHTQLVVFRLE